MLLSRATSHSWGHFDRRSTRAHLHPPWKEQTRPPSSHHVRWAFLSRMFFLPPCQEAGYIGQESMTGSHGRLHLLKRSCYATSPTWVLPVLTETLSVSLIRLCIAIVLRPFQFAHQTGDFRFVPMPAQTLPGLRWGISQETPANTPENFAIRRSQGVSA